MDRRSFLSLGVGTIFTVKSVMKNEIVQPEKFYFKDDGKIPNSKHPLLLYRNAFEERGAAGAAYLEQKFASNDWSNSWRNGIFSYHHYHSISHEVLGIYKGTVLVHLGGESGEKVRLNAGDIVIIPAGVGHKNLESDSLGVVGAYPGGMDYDIKKGEDGDRPGADANIAAVPFPKFDPFLGDKGGLKELWLK
jgi:uncharacterized protein YjlB